jgi:hypothetical protein
MATVTQKQPGADIVVTTAFELIGVGLLALLAGTNDNLGRVIIVIMAGWIVLWALSHTGVLSKRFGTSPAFSKLIG